MAKRQKEGTEALVYAYGLLDEQPDLYSDPNVAAEVARQRELWDTLVLLEQEHEDRAYEYLDANAPEYRASFERLCEAARALSSLIAQRRRERAAARAKIDTSELDAAIAEATRAWKAAQKAMWAARKAARQEHKEALAALRAEHVARIPKQKDLPLFWCNANRVKQAFKATLDRVRKQGRSVRLSDPDRNDVCLTVQIKEVRGEKGCSFDDLLEGRFSALKIDKVHEDAWTTTRANRRRLSRTAVTMRVDREWNTVRALVTLDRPVPPEARIKSAQLVWRRVGGRYVGKLCLTLSMTAVERINHSTAACGVDMGWRRAEDGSLRVATIVDTATGNEVRLKRTLPNGDVMLLDELPTDWMTGMDQVERLSQYLDDAALDVATLLLGRDDLPPPVASAIKGWRPGLGAGHVNVAALSEAVRAVGFSGLPPELSCGEKDWKKRADRCCWYHRYVHLSTWRDDLRQKLLLRRKEIYRLAALELAERYAVIAIEDLDLATLALTKKRNDGADPALHAGARAQRHRACLHELRAELEHQARKRGARLAVVDAAKTTITCHECGTETKQSDRDRMMRHMFCEACGAIWDQDVNAARNILAAAIGASGDVPPTDDDGGSGGYAGSRKGISDRSQPGADSL